MTKRSTRGRRSAELSQWTRAARAIATEGSFDGFAGLMSNGELNAFFAAAGPTLRTPRPDRDDAARRQLAVELRYRPYTDSSRWRSGWMRSRAPRRSVVFR
jgi:hypothetical protein